MKVLYFITFVILLLVLSLIFVTFKTSIFPITESVESTQIEIINSTNDSTSIRLSYVEIRQCDFVELRWFVGDRDFGPDMSAQVNVSYDPPITIDGTVTFDNVEISISRTNLIEYSYATVVYDCIGIVYSEQIIYDASLLPTTTNDDSVIEFRF